MEEQENKEVDLDQKPIILKGISEDTYNITVEASIICDKEIHKVHTTLDLDDVTTAIQEAKFGYIPPDYGWHDIVDDFENEDPVIEDAMAIYIPEHALDLTIKAKRLVDGKESTKEYFYGLGKIREMMKDAEDNYIPTDAKFFLAAPTENETTVSVIE